MSAKAMGKVWELVLTPAKQNVLLAYADHADHDGRNIKPGAPLIAWKTGYSERQVRRITSDLEADGLLVVDQVRSGLPTVYHIDFSKGKQKPPFERRPRRQRGDKMSMGNDGQHVTGDMLSGVTSHEESHSNTPDMPSAESARIRQKEEPSFKEQKREGTHRAKPSPAYGFKIDWSLVEGAGGSLQRADGTFVSDSDRPLLAQAALKIFNAYLFVMRDLGRASMGRDEQQWEKHQTPALMLALANADPEAIARFVQDKYTDPDDSFWRKLGAPMPLKHVADNLRAWQAARSVATLASTTRAPGDASSSSDALRATEHIDLDSLEAETAEGVMSHV